MRGFKVCTFPTLTSGSTSTSALNVPLGYTKAWVEIPSYASGADLYLLGSTDGTTFRRVKGAVTAITQAVPVNFSVGSAISNCFVELPCIFPYMKAEISTFQTDVILTFKLILSGND